MVADSIPEVSKRLIYAATRQNMYRPMILELRKHLRKRNIIESDWGVLKHTYFFGISSGKMYERSFPVLRMLKILLINQIIK